MQFPIVLDDFPESTRKYGVQRLDILLPERDTVPIYSPMGLVAGCPNERNGRLLYDYILSKEGQTILTEHHLHSIRDDLGNTPDSIQTVLDSRLPVNEQEISDTMEDVMDRFDSFLLVAPTFYLLIQVIPVISYV